MEANDKQSSFGSGIAVVQPCFDIYIIKIEVAQKRFR